jgi:outer membrane scaffolding protein for murein synthesis (MipA/OmpV family)
MKDPPWKIRSIAKNMPRTQRLSTGHPMGPAADSTLVGERGSKNQWLFGVSATYRFDFQL